MDHLRSWLDSGTWTEDAYFALPETNHLLELADGQLIVLEMPTLAHQRASRQLVHHLEAWNQGSSAGEVLYAPYPVQLRPGRIREPDVMFYRSEHRERLGEQRGGPPDLAIEVISPSTKSTDLGTKLTEYAQAGVEEYWIVDPEARWIAIYTLEGRRYRLVARYTPGQEVTSQLLPGLRLAVADVFGSARGAPTAELEPGSR